MRLCNSQSCGRMALDRRPRLEQIANLGQQHFLRRRCRGCFVGLWRFAAQHVDGLDHHEQRKGHDHELDQRVDEEPDIERGHARSLSGRQRRDGDIFGVGQDNEQVGKIDPPDDQSYDGHEDVIDQRGHNRCERRTDDDTHRHVDHIAANGKFFEFLDKRHISLRSLSGRQLDTLLAPAPIRESAPR